MTDRRAQLALTTLILIAVALVAWRVRTVRQKASALLYLDENVTLGVAPTLPGDDLNVLRGKLDDLSLKRRLASGGTQQSLIALANVALSEGDNATAIESFKRIEVLRPLEMAMLLRLARCYIEVGKLDLAASIYRDFKVKEPTGTTGYLGLYQVYSAQNRVKEALETLDECAAHLAPGDSESRMTLAQTWEIAGDLPRALREYNQLHQDQARYRGGMIGEARCLFKQLRVTEAQNIVQQLVGGRVEDRGALQLFARILVNPLNPNKNPKKAEDIWLKLLQEMPSNLDLMTRLGEHLQDEGRYRAAAYVWMKSLEYQPDFATARLRLASCYSKMGDRANADIQRSVAKKLVPRDQDDQRLIGAKNRYPIDMKFRLALASHYEDTGRYHQAFIEYRSCLGLQPGNSLAMTALRSLYAKAGATWTD